MARNILADNGFKSFYITTPVEGYTDEGITFGEKYKLSVDTIKN